ncbi:hypothetical protein FH972_010531 [Carpinus fangiana]|uniref:Uncharacterized protein n=1 Tax=Carpinus fangiana TaxID=176857 RepID=A0A660KNK9_9ROSI|nr:hypothetical protein FH972_010531 [Carpinus fangiana]
MRRRVMAKQRRGSKEARERSGEVCRRRGLTVDAKSRRGDATNKAKQKRRGGLRQSGLGEVGQQLST